ncbi:MAG: CBS domain-containing protein [Candidatus Hydrogenedentes bacterium]|nr:CBS domain-containing protein [Candidatus Hydrogenedentota bacterium]
MTKDVVTVTPDCPIMEAMRLLVHHGLTGLPVVSGDGQLLGILSEKDMLRLLYEKPVGDASVEEFMTRDVVSFDENDNLIDICECLIANQFRRVPILSSGKLAGIISRGDIIRCILKARKADAPPEG